MTYVTITFKSSGEFRGLLGHSPPLATNLFFAIGKNKKTWFGPFCVCTSGRQKFGPLYEILNTPLLNSPWNNS